MDGVLLEPTLEILTFSIPGGLLRGQRGRALQRGSSHSEALQRTHRGYREHLCSSSGEMSTTLESWWPINFIRI